MARQKSRPAAWTKSFACRKCRCAGRKRKLAARKWPLHVNVYMYKRNGAREAPGDRTTRRRGWKTGYFMKPSVFFCRRVTSRPRWPESGRGLVGAELRSVPPRFRMKRHWKVGRAHPRGWAFFVMPRSGETVVLLGGVGRASVPDRCVGDRAVGRAGSGTGTIRAPPRPDAYPPGRTRSSNRQGQVSGLPPMVSVSPRIR